MRTRLAHVGQPFLTADHNSAFQVVFEEKPSSMLPASPYTLPACFQPLPACSQLASSISLHACSMLPARFQHAPSLPAACSQLASSISQDGPSMHSARFQHAPSLPPAPHFYFQGSQNKLPNIRIRCSALMLLLGCKLKIHSK